MADQFFSDRALQQAYRELMMGARDGHIDEATWDRIVSNQIDPAARDAVFDHVVECEACTRIWRGILALQDEATKEGLIPPAPIAHTPIWRSRGVALAIAATLVVAVAGVIMMRQPAPVTDSVRGSEALSPIEGLMVANSAESVPMFIWTPNAAATAYKLEVFNADGTPAWTREVAKPPAPWPADVPQAKGSYRWRVEAIDDGQPIARSRLTAYDIK